MSETEKVGARVAECWTDSCHRDWVYHVWLVCHSLRDDRIVVTSKSDPNAKGISMRIRADFRVRLSLISNSP